MFLFCDLQIKSCVLMSWSSICWRNNYRKRKPRENILGGRNSKWKFCLAFGGSGERKWIMQGCEVSNRLRYWLTLTSGVLECLWFAGVVFGYASLVFVLKDDGYFSDLCVSDQDSNGTLTSAGEHLWSLERSMRVELPETQSSFFYLHSNQRSEIYVHKYIITHIFKLKQKSLNWIKDLLFG